MIWPKNFNISVMNKQKLKVNSSKACIVTSSNTVLFSLWIYCVCCFVSCYLYYVHYFILLLLILKVKVVYCKIVWNWMFLNVSLFIWKILKTIKKRNVVYPFVWCTFVLQLWGFHQQRKHKHGNTKGNCNRILSHLKPLQCLTLK